MGNAVGSGVSGPHSPPPALRLRRGKRITGCPCFLSEQASTWEAVTLHDKFRAYVLRHLLDEAFICSILEHGEREHALGACEGVLYYKYVEEGQRCLLWEKLEAWQRAAGAGMTTCEGLNAESACAELQLAQPVYAFGFLPTLQRRLAVLRELGAVIAEEQRSQCRPFHIRSRAPPPSGCAQEQGDIRLALMMNTVALQSLSTLALFASALQHLNLDDGARRENLALVHAPFAKLADMLGEFPAQSLFKYWSPTPTDPERKVTVDPETATASCAASLARLAVTGGLHVGWKSTSTGSSFVTWQVALSEPTRDITSVAVQWGTGDPATGADQHAIPLALSIEASVDGGKVWYGITGGDESVDVALAHKASAGSSRHRYPVSLLGLLRKRAKDNDSHSDGVRDDVVPLVTHIRLKMKGPSSNGSAGALIIYDVAVNARDPSARTSDVLTVLRQIQTFLLTQHSRDSSGLQEHILRGLLGVCKASCALEFELDLVRVYMTMEHRTNPTRLMGATTDTDPVDGGSLPGNKDGAPRCLEARDELRDLVSTLGSAASRAKRRANRQDRERVIRDAGFDLAMSSKWVVISEGGQLVSSADNGNSHSLVRQCLRRGVWSWILGLERESNGDETTCVGVAVHPVTNSSYEESHQMWMVRCYSGETYSNGGRRNLMTCKIHPLDSVRLTLNCEAGTLALEVNGVDQGIVFSNIPRDVYPAVCFYGVTKSVRLVELRRTDSELDSDMSDEDDGNPGDMEGGASEEGTPLASAVPGTQSVVQEETKLDSTHASNFDASQDTSFGDDRNEGSVGHELRETPLREVARERTLSVDFPGYTEEYPSAGLLASLANLAQWYIPRDQDERMEEGVVPRQANNRMGSGERSAESMAGRSSEGLRSSSIHVSGDYPDHVPPQPFSTRIVQDRETRRFVGQASSVANPVRRIMRSSHQSTARHIPSIPRFIGKSPAHHRIDTISRRRRATRARQVARAFVVREALQVSSKTVRGCGIKPVSLEEPYVLQPTATVFQKLHELLVQSLARLNKLEESSGAATPAKDLQEQRAEDGTRKAAVSTVLSILQIMRANFCRLVDAHVDPAEVGLSLEYGRGRSRPREANDVGGRASHARLLPNILSTLQGIMLREGSNGRLLRATVDTFSSGLPLLMPRIEDRLHLLLALVQHLKHQDGAFSRAHDSNSTRDYPSLPEDNKSEDGLMNIPGERLTLLRNLFRHLSRTESVLELLVLFEEDETERNAVSDLLELMLSSVAHMASFGGTSSSLASQGQHSLTRDEEFEQGSPPQPHLQGESISNPLAWGLREEARGVKDDLEYGSRPSVCENVGPGRSCWERLVASGLHGAALSFTFLETCQQHLLYMVLDRDRAQPNPHELLLCQYGQCLLQCSSLPLWIQDARKSYYTADRMNHREAPQPSAANNAGVSDSLSASPVHWSSGLLTISLFRRAVLAHTTLKQVCSRVLRSQSCYTEGEDDNEDPWWQLVGVLLPPFLHGLCLCADRPRVAEGLLPSLVCLSETLTKRISKSPYETAVASMAEETLRQTQLSNPEEGLALAPSGWHPVRASFEVDKDCMTSFAISEDGQLYSALTSSNTCALVDVGISQGKAAWEFLLEEDTLSDECSVFGIATKPLYSRCYNSSPYLRMRRAYNGVLYDRGRQLPGSHNMPKVHPGDVLRCEVDMDEGTLRFRVNGEKQDGGFDDLEGEVFPCAGSYRSGVTIRLLKMEIMGGGGLARASDDNGFGAGGWDPTEISWAAAPFCKTSRGGIVAIDKKAMELRRMSASCVLHHQWNPRPISEADGAASKKGSRVRGKTDRTELEGSALGTLSSDNSDTDRAGVGGFGGNSHKSPNSEVNVPCGGEVVEVADPKAWEWVTVRATRSLGRGIGRHAVEMEVTPVGTGSRRVSRNPRPSSSADRTGLRRYPMAFGLTARDVQPHDQPVGMIGGSWAWWTDGSLRAHGEVLSPGEEGMDRSQCEVLYGLEFLPLKPCDVITMVMDTYRGTLRYLVNGVDLGVAFGPPDSGAVCSVPEAMAPFIWKGGAALFPSCSLTNEKQVVQLRPAGVLGTQLWPLAVDLHKTVASLSGRLCATMITGTPQDEAEVALEPWLRSPLLSGGIEASENVMDVSDWHSLGRRRWEEAWRGEQEGRLVRTRSFMGWGTRKIDGAPKAHTPGQKGTTSRTESPPSGEHCVPTFCSELNLTVTVVRATNIPKGLILWPDVPSIRLTAIVDGRDAGSCEELLMMVHPSSKDCMIPQGEGPGVVEGSGKKHEHESKGQETIGDEESLGGKEKHVFVLQLPEGAHANATNVETATLPLVLLRGEILIGSIVTASGHVVVVEAGTVRDEKSLSTSSTLQMKEGGNILLALELTFTEPSSANRGGASRVQRGREAVTNSTVGRLRSMSSQSSPPAVVRMKRFLESIASWGTREDEEPGAFGGHGDLPDACRVDPSSRVLQDSLGDGTSGSKRESEWNGEMGEGCLYPDLVEWLGRSHPDPPFLRKALEKTGNYSFPTVEAPFLAALLKHSGLAEEAFQAAEMMSAGKDDGDGESQVPLPTKDMGKLWGRVRQLRAHLRTQRQQFKVMAADSLHLEASARSMSGTDGAALPHSTAETKEEILGRQDDDKGVSENVTSSDDNEGGQSYPTTFAELCAQTAEHARFLLELAPSTIRCASAAAEGTSVLVQHLTEELSELPTPPAAKLRSRLLRWRSEDRGKERWKGVVDVLRAQSQLRRCTSCPRRPRAKSLGSRPHGLIETATRSEDTRRDAVSSSCIEESQEKTDSQTPEVQDGAPEVAGTWTSLAGESGCASADESDDSGESVPLDNATAASAALQACTIYVITGGAVAAPRILKGTLRSRTARAAMRTFGLQALAALIRTLAPEGNLEKSTGSQSAVQEALLFLRPAFLGLRVKREKGGRKVEIVPDDHDPRHHYLKGLEGCSSSLLAGVQHAFEDLYGLLRKLLDYSLQTGQPGLAHVLMTAWTLDFESRDFRFLAQDSGILPTLQAVVTLTNTSDMACSALARPSPVANDALPEEARSEHGTQGRYRWTPWSLESVRESYLQGKLMARDFARHIGRIPPSALPAGFLESVGLEGSQTELLCRYSMGSLMRRYSALLRAHLKHAKAKVEKQELAAADERKRLERVSRERVEELISRGVPVLDERESRKAPEVHLTALCTWATVPLVESVACTFARGLTYAGTGSVPVAEAEAVASAISKSGNYFEVTVMNPGDKTTIGVGLADPDVFPATKQMPGWVDHSYGYHGDDGRKFGRGKTDSIWPTWVDGDVIGCGFDPTRGAIWYTQNGRLLGDGFLDVYDSSLVPVVGFHSNGESVRVNFGLSPFMYEGPEVVVGSAVLAERERMQQARSDDENASAYGCRTEDGAGTEEKEEGVVEAKMATFDELADRDILDWIPSDGGVAGESEWISWEMLAPSMKVMQRGASSLLRFLVVISMRQAASATVAAPGEHGMRESPVGDSRRQDGDAHRIARDNDRLATPSSVAPAGSKGAASSTNPVQGVILPPTRERSMYGTPFEHMRTHVESLHQDIFDLMLRELRLGSLSMKYIFGANNEGGGGRTVSMRIPQQDEEATDPFIPEASDLSGKTSKTMDHAIRRSFSHSYCVRGTQSLRSSGSWRRPDAIGCKMNKKEDISIASLGLSALEIGEVEPYMFRLLALLCSVRHFTISRVQLAHPSALRSLMSLLQVGSPRIQRCVLLLLGAVLPTLEPAAVDSCLPEDWIRATNDEAATQTSSKLASRKEQEAGSSASRSPHSLEGVLGVAFATVRKAYAPVAPPSKVAPNDSGGRRFDGDRVNPDFIRRGQRGGQGSLAPGCDEGYGGGMLDLCLAEQCSSLIRELYKEPAWKEQIARTLLVSIRMAASAIRDTSSTLALSSPVDFSQVTPSGQTMEDIMSDAVAAVAIIAGGSGVLYPGVTVQSASGASGTVVFVSPGEAEAGVVFDGQQVEGCEKVLVSDLEVTGAGFQTDPDTPAQPVIAQLLSLLGALLGSKELTRAMKTTDPEEYCSDVPAIAWSRLLSQTLVAVSQLSVYCGDAVVAACLEGDVVSSLLPILLRVALCPVPLPALLTLQDFRHRWRAAQARVLSAHHLSTNGLRVLKPLQKRRLPTVDPLIEKKLDAKAPTASNAEDSQPYSGTANVSADARDAPDAEELREDSHSRPQGHSGEARVAAPDLTTARWPRIGGRGRLMDLGDSHRGWGRGWGSTVYGRRTMGSWSSLDLEVRSAMERDEHMRRRLLPSEVSQRAPTRGRRSPPSVDSRLDPRRSAPRVFHTRMRGLLEPRDEETEALLVEFNDGTDEMATDVHGMEGESAGSAETADTSQDGDEEMTPVATGDHESSRATEDAADVDVNHRPTLPHLVPYVGDECNPPTTLHSMSDERTAKLKHRGSSPCFPLSHVLCFGSEAKSRREALGARLSVEYSVPYVTALAVVEAFGEESEKSQQWLQTQQRKKDRHADESVTKSSGQVADKDCESDKVQGEVTDAFVVSSLVNMGEGLSFGDGGDAASVPSAEDGLNLWGTTDGEELEAVAQETPTLTQRADLLCEHDLTPVVGIPRPSPGVGGAIGTVTSSFLVREVDVLTPGSLLMVTSGEGYAPDKLGPCVTVAREIGQCPRQSRGPGRGASSFIGAGKLSPSGLRESCAGESCLSADGFARESSDGLLMDDEEVLVEMLDAETGLCLGRRVPMGDLRHSASFFGRELNHQGTAVLEVLHHTDGALCVLRARSLLIRLIHSLPTPAVAAAGGPQGLLNLTRLLAAQHLARGDVPTSSWSNLHIHQHGPSRLEVALLGGRNDDGTADTCGQEGDAKLVRMPELEQDSLLKVLWRKVMQSPDPWISDRSEGVGGGGTLGEMLAKEVLDSFSSLTVTPLTYISGGVDARQADGSEPRALTPDSQARDSIVHESLHPLCAPLSYGGHLKVDYGSHGMVVKMDSRSRTSTSSIRLQFFASKEDMLNCRDPVRVMHGYDAERSERARSRGLEFFKVEEAHSSWPHGTSSVEETPGVNGLNRLCSSPPLGRQGSFSTSVSVSVSSSHTMQPTGISRRSVASSTSKIPAQESSEPHNQMVTGRWSKSKDESIYESSVFRSFVLPGVHELWFRVDAPPGAHKPSLRVKPLVGSLDQTLEGAVRPNPDPSKGLNTRKQSERDEEYSQEDMGLKALFTFFGGEHAADEVLRVDGTNNEKGTDVEERPPRIEIDEREAPALPSCLVVAEDVRLTRGRWFYEVEIESLETSAVADDSLRIGWAHWELGSALQVGATLKSSARSSRGGDKARAAPSGRHDATSQALCATNTEQHVGRPERQEFRGALDPLMRTFEWLFETKDNCVAHPSTRSDSRSGDSDMHPRIRASTESHAAGGLGEAISDAPRKKQPKVDAGGRGVGFPVLGSNSGRLGLGLDDQGFVWSGGQREVQVTHSLAPADVIGCALDMDSGNVWFSLNGSWTAPGHENTGRSISALNWDVGKARMEDGIRPCLSLRGNTSVSVNFGSTPFKYDPPANGFQPIVLREVQAGARKTEGTSSNDASQSSQKQPKQNMAREEGINNENWGFRFVVDPLRGVHYRVVREVELICRLGMGSRGGAGSTKPGSQVLSIWRPKPPAGWFSVGDVATRGMLPPAGAIVVRADLTGCLVSKPAKYRVVHQDKASGFVVWRPVPRKGQVSLGDFACAKKASKAVLPGAVRCVAAWAVERCPVVECLWREDKQSGSQAIWSVQNGLGTFFGSLTGSRLSKKEVTQGPHSRSERQKKKKKKKKKKKGSGEESSEDEEGERVKLRLGVGEGWALRGVSAACITHEWSQESDVIAGPSGLAQEGASDVSPDLSKAAEGYPVASEVENMGNEGTSLSMAKPRPSASWASWLLSFLLTHPSLRHLAMRASLFRTLVAYLRSPWAPCRLRMVPLLTLLVRSHAEFEDGPPPLEDLDGLATAVLQECDRVTYGRGPGSAAWRQGDCPGGTQLETKWASEGLVLLTDLITAARRARDTLSQGPQPPLRRREREVRRLPATKAVTTGAEQQRDADLREGLVEMTEINVDGSDAGDRVKVTLPPFGTRVDEGPLEEGEDGEADEAERHITDRVLLGGKSLCAEDRALLEVDLRNAVLPGVCDSTVEDVEVDAADAGEDSRTSRPTPSPSRCLHHLLEISDTLQALRDGWPSSISESCESGREISHATQPAQYLDSILCEAWMDAVGPAAVIESDHPFRQGTTEETLSFPGAEELVVFLDPRSSMSMGKATLSLEVKDKAISLTGQQEIPWSDVITFHGSSLSYRFVAAQDGMKQGMGIVIDGAGMEDWGFRFTVVAKGPVWEVTTVEGDNPALDGGHDYELKATVPGAISLLVELDETRESSPHPEIGIAVEGFDEGGRAVHRGLLTGSSVDVPVYVPGDSVQLLPRGRCPLVVDASADAKDEQKHKDESRRSSVMNNEPSPLSLGPDGPTPQAARPPSDSDALPDADAKLERLPSNAPVLRPWGEAAGVERRWQSPSNQRLDVNRVPFTNASYMSNTATIEIGDSDAESKDGSTQSPASSGGERPLWTRYATLNDVISTGLPVLTAVSSTSSDGAARGTSHGFRGLLNMASTRGLGIGAGTGAGAGAGAGRANGNVSRAVGMGVRDANRRSGESSLTDGSLERNAGARMPAERAEPGGIEDDGGGDDDHAEKPCAVSPRLRDSCGAGDETDSFLHEEEGLEMKALSSSIWAVKVRATAMPRKARLRLYLERRRSLPVPGPSLEKAREWMREWTREMDLGLLELLGAVGAKSMEDCSSGLVSNTLNPWSCRLTRAEASFQLQCLAAIPLESLHIRAALLLRLNDRIERVLPVIDLGSKQEDSLGYQLREMNHLILPRIKNAVLEAALAVTQGPGDGVAVTLDNMKAMASRDRGEKDLASSQCVFAQAYRQLRDTEAKVLRTVWDGERVFQINFVGEDGVDAGGVFREGMSRMVEDLFSPDFDLLIQCPNGKQAVGQNNEKFVPNPQHTSPLALSMLRFVGRLMGLSLRTRLCLPFQLPSMIWKRMLGLQVNFEDLRMVDTIICQFLTAIRTCEDDGVTTDEEFRDKYGERLFFTCTGSDGVEREVAPGGAARRVTFHNRWSFCRMVEEARAHEFDAQARAMADGLSDIVPMKVLRLFTAKQLEIAVAGEPEFDIAFWREHTEYKGYRADDSTVEIFWKVIASMNNEDQSGFVRFAWGRSRLPPKAFWKVNMKLLRRNTGEDSLPVSHTCFFSVELPPYSTEELMRKGLLTAIHFGMGGILNA